jgi:hypothetical protein
MKIRTADSELKTKMVIAPVMELVAKAYEVEISIDRQIVRVDSWDSPFVTYEPGRGATIVIKIDGGA